VTAEGPVALVLAADLPPPVAGFTGPKHLVELDGRPLLRRVLDDVWSWPVGDVVVVLGPDAEQILESVSMGPATVVIDEGWQEGAAAPLRAGLDTIWRGGDVEPIVIAHGDQPGIGPELVARLLERWRADPRAAVVPEYRFAAGWPVIVGASIVPRLLGLEDGVDLVADLAGHEGLATVHVDRLEPPRILDVEDLPTRRR